MCATILRVFDNIFNPQLCQQLGWKGPGGRFDVLPLVLSAEGHDPEMFEIPPKLILEVQLTHPE